MVIKIIYMKNLFLAIFCSAVLISGITSCSNTEDDIFDKPSAERLSEAIASYTDFFSGSETLSNEWIMEYFPVETSPGFIYQIRFVKDGSGFFATKNPYVNGGNYIESPVASLWEVIGDNGPVLSFNSYSNIFHCFADPGTDGRGYEGDYEFVILAPDDDNTIRLRGKKRGTAIRMIRLPKGEWGESYFDKIDRIENALFSDAPNGLDLIIGSKRYTCVDGGTRGVFGVVPVGGDFISEMEYAPFVVTATGIKMYQPFEEDGISAQYFTYNSETQTLVCDQTPSVYFESEYPVNYFMRTQAQFQKWILTENMSATVKSAYDRMIAGGAAKNFNFKQLIYEYEPSLRKSHVVSVIFNNKSGKKTVCNYDFDLANTDGYNMVASYKGTADGNGEVFLGFDGFKEWIDILNSSFKVSAGKENKLNLSNIRFESIEDPDIWFNLELVKE